MIDFEKMIQEQTDKMTDATEQQKQDFNEMATAFGSFMTCIWKKGENKDNETVTKNS